MRVYVDDTPVQVWPGTTVKHALIGGGRLEEIEGGKKVYDEWGNEVGLDGALEEGAKLYLR
jgi:hypothetical protein